jgi:hypothetical protein
MRTVIIDLNSACSIKVEFPGDDNIKYGNITSNGLHGAEGDKDYDDQYEAAVDGIEALILSLACAGVDVTTMLSFSLTTLKSVKAF